MKVVDSIGLMSVCVCVNATPDRPQTVNGTPTLLRQTLSTITD